MKKQKGFNIYDDGSEELSDGISYSSYKDTEKEFIVVIHDLKNEENIYRGYDTLTRALICVDNHIELCLEEKVSDEYLVCAIYKAGKLFRRISLQIQTA